MDEAQLNIYHRLKAMMYKCGIQIPMKSEYVSQMIDELQKYAAKGDKDIDDAIRLVPCSLRHPGPIPNKLPVDVHVDMAIGEDRCYIVDRTQTYIVRK